MLAGEKAKWTFCLAADTLLRLGFGVMFIVSAWGKIQDPGAFQTMVSNYDMLPQPLTAAMAMVMPMVELLTGLMFMFTKWTREAAFLTFGMLVMFIIALTQAQLRGLDISCGCFREAEGAGDSVLSALVRDLAMMPFVVWLLHRGQSRWITDFRK